MSPLKLYEYFGGGKPVISTPVPECEAFAEVRIVRNAREFAAALDPARADGKDPGFRVRLSKIAAANTWAVRLEAALGGVGPVPTSNALEDVVKRKMRKLWRPGNRFFFDALAKHLSALADDPCLQMYFEFSLSANERGRQLAALLGQHTSLEGRHVLDVGCASGGFLIAFGEAGAQPVGLDLNPLLLALAKANFKDAGAEYPVYQRDVTDPAQVAEFREAFDVVTCNDVLEHVRDPATAIRNIASVLKPGGLAYFEIPNRDAASAVESDGHYQMFGITQLSRNEAEAYFQAFHPDTPYGVEHYLHLGEYRRLFEDAGLQFEVLPETVVGVMADAAKQTLAKIRGTMDSRLADAPPEHRERVRAAVIDYLEEAEAAAARLPAGEDQFLLRFASPFWRILARKPGDSTPERGNS
jgi:2-polyprenyl-3-methyl-5-hydroxy-6-metoxy-1,4-benzoquinol methylase